MSSLPSSQPNEPRRRFLVPPVIQTSAMDCGPAALASLLEGFGVPIGYGRLREACQTAVDGTSIDRLETLAVSLGLDAEQIMLPVEHLLIPEAEALPAIVLVKAPSGLTHFVVAWRAHGALVQVMDPARGRRWVRRASFLESVHRHEMAVPEEAFRAWAASAGFTGPLARRLRALGVSDPDAPIARALAEPGWSAIAALDAAARTVAVLVGARAVATGPGATRLVEALAAAAPVTGRREEPPGAPAAPVGEASLHAIARPAPPAPDGTPQVWLRGAVLLRVAGAARLDEADRAALPIELRAAVEEPPARPGAALARLLARDGPWLWSALAAGVGLLAVGAVAEGLLFQTLFDLGVGRGGGLLGAALTGLARVGSGAVSVELPLVAMLALLVALGALELLLGRGLCAAGTRLDGRLRWQFGRKIPRLADRYFQTRPVSDLAARAHQLDRLRELPALVADVARTALELVLIAGALAWLVPRSAPLVLAVALSMLVIPVLAAPFVAERDLQMRSHASALGRFHLDGLLGLVAARTHRAEPALAREHGDRLRPWTRAARGALGGALLAEAAQALVGLGLVVWLLERFFSAGPPVDPGGALLVVYWALSLPALGQQLGKLVQRIPAQRNLTLRLIEALEAPDETSDRGQARADAQADPLPLSGPGLAAAADAPVQGGASIRIDDLRVVAGGHSILEIEALGIGPGEHVAIVGSSGAGKSSLVGLLLGWQVPSTGVLRVDGAVLDGDGLRALRRRAAWVEPAVYLWNRSLAENLAYGLAEGPSSEPPAGLDGALDAAALADVVGRLPEGLGTVLGEAGALVSGGEGQRVRFGRGLLRPGVRLAILDEPFRGLPRAQRSALLLRARRWWGAATLLCVTHDIAETAGFPRVLVLDGGKIVEDGVPAALLARPGSHYARLAEAEARVAEASWSHAVWRRMHLRDGRVVGGPP